MSLQANVTDNCDGTYALQFSLALAGDWALSASVGGREVPWPEAAQLRAEYAPLAAKDCEISGVDGLVSCGSSDPIFIQVSQGTPVKAPQAVYEVLQENTDLDSEPSPSPERNLVDSCLFCSTKHACALIVLGPTSASVGVLPAWPDSLMQQSMLCSSERAADADRMTRQCFAAGGGRAHADRA